MRIIIFSAILCSCTVAFADEIIFKNGDKLTGEIKSADGGKLKIKSKVAGEVTVDMKDVQTFSTDKPLNIRLKDKTMVHDTVAAGESSEVVAHDRAIPLDQVKRINTPTSWTGSVLVNGNLSRGNTHSEDLGVTADASLRRDDETHNDR